MHRRSAMVTCLLVGALGTSRKVFAQTAAVRQIKPKVRPSNATLLGLINTGGRLRMLVLRIGKAYAQIGLGILPRLSQKILTESIKAYDSHLKLLLTVAPSTEISKNYQEIETLWKNFKTLLLLETTPATGLYVQAQSDVLLKLADAAVENLDNLLGLNSGALVNLSGRQRLLSQRLARNVLFKEWTKTNDTSAQIINDEAEFVTALSNLVNDRETTEAVKVELRFADTQWLFFQSAIQASLNAVSNRVELEYIANTSERILQLFDEITNHFEKNGLTK